MRRRNSRRRRNPGVVSTFTSVLPVAGYAIAGAVATAAIPDMILGKNNSGVVGYAADAATAVALSMIGGATLGGNARDGLLIGGAVRVVSRLIGDLMGRQILTVSPLRGMRGYGPLDFVLPSATRGLSYRLPAAVAPVVAAGVGNYRNFRGRSKFAG